jgi:glycosyltransferase involved in cell wall biosynthesis
MSHHVADTGSGGDQARGRAKVLAIASHPIQYQSPLFRALAQSQHIDFSVLFVQLPDAQQQGRGFGVAFEWDIPVLEGYRWKRVPQLRGRGGLDGFFAARIQKPLSLLRELDPDVVLITGWHVWPLVQMVMAARRAGIPVIMRGESNALRRRPWLTRQVHRLLLSQCAAFLPIGRSSRDFYRGYGFADRQLFDTPYFVDNARFVEAAEADAAQKTNLRDKWGIPRDAICFCYAGKLERKKRILDLVEALRIAVQTSALPLHLLIVGTGELMEAARRAVDEHRLPVTFAGFLNQTEIPQAYIAADCLVLPSDYGETWGLVVNEAMVCGKAAIVSDRVGCGPDLITFNVTGAIVPFGDTAALANQIVMFAADPQGLARMGIAARDRVLQHYSVERSAAGVLRAVEYVTGAR